MGDDTYTKEKQVLSTGTAARCFCESHLLIGCLLVPQLPFQFPAFVRLLLILLVPFLISISVTADLPEKQRNKKHVSLVWVFTFELRIKEARQIKFVGKGF